MAHRIINVLVIGFFHVTIDVIYATGASRVSPPTVREFCETETFNPKCSENEVIMIKSARYGRMRIGRCVRKDLGYIGCYSDVLHLADRRCSGKFECTIRLPDPMFDTETSCLAELKTYFEVGYECVPVWTPPFSDCKGMSQLHLTEPEGFIANVMSLTKHCGKPDHPYVITVEPGQRINITLWDFSVRTTSGVGITTSTTCKPYAVIEDQPANARKTVCSSSQRREMVYMSENNTVEIKMVPSPNPNDVPSFLLHYKATGCADIPLADGMWMERSGESLTVGCSDTKEKWSLTCDEKSSKWKGSVGNCSESAVIWGMGTTKGQQGLSYATSIAIIFLIAFIIGISVFIIGFIAFRSRCKNDHRRYQERQEVHYEIDHPSHLELHDRSTFKMVECSDPRSLTPCKHGTKRIVKMDNNDYAHIWETSLPHPASFPAADGSHQCVPGERRLSQPDCRALHQQQRQPMLQSSHDELDIVRDVPPVCEVCDTLPRGTRKVAQNEYPYEAARYFVLDRDAMMADPSQQAQLAGRLLPITTMSTCDPQTVQGQTKTAAAQQIKPTLTPCATPTVPKS